MESHIIKSYCNVCFGEKKHTVLYTKNQYHEDIDEEDGALKFYESADYILAECNGCEHISLIIEHSTSGGGGDYTSHYPPKTIKQEPQWLFDLMMREMFLNPYKTDFLTEIYIALRNNTPRLAVIGIRALLEQLMIEKVGDHKTFTQNLSAFEKNGFISQVQRTAIEPLIEAGHASTHRGFKAKTEEIVYLIDVIENLIESIYINHEQTKKIEVPAREK